METLNIKEYKNGVMCSKDYVDKKITNGYLYDSLVYRYILARKAMAELEWEIDKKENRGMHFTKANRDILKFCQLLDEAIGEHV